MTIITINVAVVDNDHHHHQLFCIALPAFPVVDDFRGLVLLVVNSVLVLGSDSFLF